MVTLFLSIANGDWIAKTMTVSNRYCRRCGREYDNLRADGDVVVKVGDVIIGQTDAAG